MTASSAYSWVLMFWQTFGKSLIYKENKTGPSMEPWGTPTWQSRWGDLITLIDTQWILFSKYDFIQRMACSEKLNFVNWLDFHFVASPDKTCILFKLFRSCNKVSHSFLCIDCKLPLESRWCGALSPHKVTMHSLSLQALLLEERVCEARLGQPLGEALESFEGGERN